MSDSFGEGQVTSQGCTYTVKVDARTDGRVEVTVSQNSPAARWIGSFTAAYLESLTEKACSARRYGAFIAMLLAALRRTSSSVSLDILSFSDLAAMKAGSSQRASSLTGHRAAASSKRYLILTYMSEFERVHYPLPLGLQTGCSDTPEQPSAAAAAAAEAAAPAMSDLLAEISHLKTECCALRRQLRHTSRAAGQARNPHSDAALQQALDERDAALSAAHAARAEAERVATAFRRQQRQAQHQVACAAADLQRARAEAERWQARCQVTPLEAQQPNSWRRGVPRPHSATARGGAGRASGWSSGAGRSRSPDRRSSAHSVHSQASAGATTRPRASLRPAQRPWSAPTPPRRFDPTQYVRQRHERELLLAARLGRRPVTLSPTSRRPSARSAAACDTASRDAEQPYSRSASPGRALQNLKARLQRDMQCHGRTADRSAAQSERQPQQRRRQRPDSATVQAEADIRGRQQRPTLDAETARDMADIDSRLLALQKFLMAAKVS